MSLIQITNLSFAYPGSNENVFENLNLQLDTDWRLGFIGRNGRGKTTFLKLLMGEFEYQGSIMASVGFDYFPFPVGNQQRLTYLVLEDIYPDCEQWRLLKEFAALELPEEVLYRPFESLSNGEQTKALLALLFLRENSFLLIDEPTNHLDLRGRELVSRYLSGKKGFILVSHDRSFLDGCIDHVLSINRSDIELQKGNFSSWFENRARQDAFELSENEKLKKEVRRLNEASKRSAGWSDRVEETKYATKNSGLRPDRGYIGHKSAKMMKRAKSLENRRQEALAEKTKLLKNLENAEKLKIMQTAYHSKRLISLDEVSLFYGDKKVCGPLSFNIEQGDRIALNGSNGSGKSSLLKLICGEDIRSTGVFWRGSGLEVSYVSQDASGLTGSPFDYALTHGLDPSLLFAMLRKLDFSRSQFEKDMSKFSEGQKKKVLLARSLCERGHLLVWDEPLNYIDLISRIQLEDLLLEFAPTILFVEHDRLFCDRLATEIINL